jgi:uncharacterized protein
VTVTVARRVAPGREAEFEDWSAELTRRAAPFHGFLGAGLLRPSQVGEPWHVIFRFASAADLHAWEASPARAQHLAAGEDLVHSTDTHRVTGLETWFALPGRTAPAPPRWKMFVVSLSATYVLQVAFNLAVGGLGWAVPLRVAVVATVVTFLMTWTVMPWAARMLQDWLYAPPRRD